MGWINISSPRPPRTDYEQFLRRNEAVKVGDVAHVKDVEYPLCSKDIQNEDLPFIPAEMVMSRDGKEGSKLCVLSAASYSDISLDVDCPRDRDR